MSQFDVYIAGSMTGRTVIEVLKERSQVKKWLDVLGMTYYDPAENEGLEKQPIWKNISNSFDKKRMKKFVSKDLNAVSESRCVLNITGDLPSDGTNWEMAYAVYHRQIPVHIVAPKRFSGEKMTFTNILVDGVHPDLPTALKAIKQSLRENK